jgi:hypothetical protein
MNRFFYNITTLGATPNPCPIVALSNLYQYNLTILNPDVVFALTVDVIEPSVFDTPAPFGIICS